MGSVERERRLCGEGLEHCEVLAREDPRLAGRGDHEHRRHLLARDERNEDGALRTDLLGHATIHPRRPSDVVDNDRAALERRAGDRGRFGLEVDGDVPPPFGVAVASDRH